MLLKEAVDFCLFFLCQKSCRSALSASNNFGHHVLAFSFSCDVADTEAAERHARRLKDDTFWQTYHNARDALSPTKEPMNAAIRQSKASDEKKASLLKVVEKHVDRHRKWIQRMLRR